jgi:hypothetical protein
VRRAYFGMDLRPAREARTKGIDGNIDDNRVLSVVAMSRTMSFWCGIVTPLQNTLFPLCRFCCIRPEDYYIMRSIECHVLSSHWILDLLVLGSWDRCWLILG